MIILLLYNFLGIKKYDSFISAEQWLKLMTSITSHFRFNIKIATTGYKILSKKLTSSYTTSLEVKRIWLNNL